MQKYRNDSHIDESQVSYIVTWISLLKLIPSQTDRDFVKKKKFQVKAKLDKLTSKHESEINDLHKQLAENKARSRETENRLREELTSLKNIIKTLEAKLGGSGSTSVSGVVCEYNVESHFKRLSVCASGTLDTGAESKVLELKTQLHSARSELDEKKRLLGKQETELANIKEEVDYIVACD